MSDNQLNASVAETEGVKEKPKTNFFGKFGVLFGALFGVLTIAVLFAPIVMYKTEVAMGDEVIEEEFFLNLVSLFQGGYPFNWTMILTLSLLALGIVLAGASFLVKEVFHKDSWKEPLSVGSALSFLVAFCFLALAREFFACNADAIENFDKAKFAIGGSMAIVFSLISAFASGIATFQERSMSISEIAEDGVLIALAFGLSFAKIPSGASGGSINFQMLPLMLIALRRGPASGLICGGLLYGLLTCLTDGYGFATFPFDYLIGFGSVAIVGFARPLVFSRSRLDAPNAPKNLVIGEAALLVAGVFSTLVRFAGSTASSMVVYGYTLEAAAAYNAVYIPVSGVCAVVPLMLLYPALLRIERIYPSKKNA